MALTTRFPRGPAGKLRAIAATIVGVAAGGICGPLAAQTASAAIEPFSNFVASLQATPAAAFVGRPGTSVANEAAFEEMRRHLLTLYSGVTVSHSVALGNQVFDCVPISQQPGLRLRGLTEIAAPPPFPPATSPTADRSEAAGNAVQAPDQGGQCEDGTIPMRRITLDEVARFETLQNFFEKGPGGAGHSYGAIPPTLKAGAHGYAHAYQFVNNYGGSSILNLWFPTVDTSSPYDNIFSLAQHWYVGGTGSSLQTAEVGWQVYPAKYGTNNAVLFIFWTPNDYNMSGPGCYNLDCTAFVQTYSGAYLGGPFVKGSVYNGQQFAFQLGYYLMPDGNWWLAYENHWIGYYPGSIYAGGQMSKYAQEIDFGGETVGDPWWPGMGSDHFASNGYKKAAYQRSIDYLDAKNNAYTPSLTQVQASPRCWTISWKPAAGGSTWGTYFYFGGPGGKLGVC